MCFQFPILLDELRHFSAILNTTIKVQKNVRNICALCAIIAINEMNIILITKLEAEVLRQKNALRSRSPQSKQRLQTKIKCKISNDLENVPRQPT